MNTLKSIILAAFVAVFASAGFAVADSYDHGHRAHRRDSDRGIRAWVHGRGRHDHRGYYNDGYYYRPGVVRRAVYGAEDVAADVVDDAAYIAEDAVAGARDVVDDVLSIPFGR